jgi:homoprotocatechuate degradation regulator HpaR
MAIQQFSRSLPMMLYRTLDAVMPAFRRIFNEFGITEQQWRILRVLWEGEAVPVGDLSELTLIPAPSLVGIIDRLEKSGLVTRQRSATDRRVVFIDVTPAGAEIEHQVMPQVARAYADLKQSVDAATWEQLMHGLDEVERVSRKAPD